MKKFARWLAVLSSLSLLVLYVTIKSKSEKPRSLLPSSKSGRALEIELTDEKGSGVRPSGEVTAEASAPLPDYYTVYVNGSKHSGAVVEPGEAYDSIRGLLEKPGVTPTPEEGAD